MNEELKQLRDTYLITLGASLDNSYNFIDSSKIEIEEKDYNEEVNIGNLKVKKDNKYRNYIVLKSVLENALDVHVNEVSNLLSSGKVVDKLQEIYDVTNLLFIDVIKYVSANIKIDENIFNLLVTLNNKTSDDFTNMFNKLMQKYNAKLQVAKETRMNMDSSMDAEIIAKASRPEYIFSRTYTRDSYLGIGQISRTRTYLGKPKGLDSLGYHPYNAVLEAFSKDDANKELVSDTLELLNNVVTKYITMFMDVLLDRLPNLYSKPTDDYTTLDYWKETIINFNLDEYSKLVDVFDYYKLDLNSFVLPVVEDSICKYYSEKYECNYDGNDLKLYLKINNISEYTISKKVSSKVRKAMYDKYYPGTSKRLKKEKKEFLERVDNCKYLLPDDKKDLHNSLSNYVAREKGFREELVSTFCGAFFGILLFAGLVIFYKKRENIELIKTIYFGLHIVNGIVWLLFGGIFGSFIDIFRKKK